MAKISLLGRSKVESQEMSSPPPDWMGSLPEWYIFQALLKLGMRGQFTYQSPMMGGRLEKGGAVIDFHFPELSLAINVQSTFYHYANYQQRIADQIQRAQLEGMGIRVIYIQEEDALRNPVYYTKEALAGIQH